MGDERLLHVRCSLRYPHRKHEGLPRPLLPLLPEIVGVVIPRLVTRTEEQRCVANYQARIGAAVVLNSDVAQLRITRNEMRLDVPNVLEQQLEESDAGHRAATDDYPAPTEV